MTSLTATRIERDVVIVSGTDAGDYLQTQLTQDVLSLDIGASAWSFLLEPKSGIVALFRVTRSAVDVYVLDIDQGWGDVVRQRIDEFLFRMDISFEQALWPGVAWRGGMPAGDLDAPIVTQTPWHGVEGLDVVGPDVAVPRDAERLDAQGLETLRIESGWPAMGLDLDTKITPAATGLVEQTVGFEKGCYTGQEFVARVHYRGSLPPRRLVRITFAEDESVSIGDEIVVDSQDSGSVTSVGQGVALGYLKRGIETPAHALVASVGVKILATP